MLDPSSTSFSNLYYLTLTDTKISERSAHRLDRSHSYYADPSRVLFLKFINACSNFTVVSGSTIRLYSPAFYASFRK
jgi:hypothetical protein